MHALKVETAAAIAAAVLGRKDVHSLADLLLSGSRASSYVVDPAGTRWVHPDAAIAVLGIPAARWRAALRRAELERLR